MAYRDVILTDSPVEYWELSEASGSTGASAGSGNHSVTHTGTTVVAGKVGNARYYDGVSDISLGASVADFMAQTNFSVEMWVKHDGTYTNDYPTFLRRDGNAKQFIVRTRKPSVGQGHIIEAYVSGRTVYTGTVTWNDNEWHHVVVTKASSTIKLYVDGVEYTTSNGTYASGGTGTASPVQLGRGNGAGEYYKGNLDEVAIYHTALSPTRITAHYDAGNDGGYTAQTMTATGAAGDAMGAGNIQTVSITDDTYNNSTNVGTNTTLVLGASGSMLFKIPAAVVGTDAALTSSKLYLRMNSYFPGPQTIEVRRADGAWTETGLTSSNMPSSTLIRSRTVGGDSIGTFLEFDITGVDTGNGVILASTAGWSVGNQSFNSAESATPAYRPYVVHTVTANTPVTISATSMTADAASPTATGLGGTGVSPTIAPMTASGLMTDATVSVGQNVNYAAQAIYVSAVSPNATVVGEKNPVLDAEPMYATADITQGGGFASPRTVAADVATAIAESVDVTVTTQKGPRIAAGVMSATANWKQAASVNGSPIIASEIDDKFFQRVMASEPKFWWRMDNLGSTITDRIAGIENNQAPNNGYLTGVQAGQFNAPDGRHSVYFNGNASIRQDENISTGATEGGVPNNTLEFSFRTTKANEFLMVIADNNGSTYSPPRELYLSNGKIGYRYYAANGTTTLTTLAGEFVGFRNLADGEWHTVVIRSTDVTGAGDEFIDGLEIYVDGKFEIRRRNAPVLTGFPDYIGSRPALLNAATSARVTLPELPSSQNFVGDMSEVIHFQRTLSADEIARHYYDFMGWNPIEAGNMDAFAFTPADSRGRGNQKRALYLWWDSQFDAYGIAGNSANNKMNFDPILSGHGNKGVYDVEGYKVFAKPATHYFGGGYRDKVTDDQTLIDLFYDVDIKDYDVIFFGDWPDEGTEFDYWRNRIPDFQSKYERLISQLRDANDLGIGLHITHPRLAVELGAVDRVEYIPTLKEEGSVFVNPNNTGFQGNAYALYDYGSAVKFPWNITNDAGMSGSDGANGTGLAMNTDPDYLGFKAYFYEDMNYNNKFRVQALVAGLTDIPSYMIKDAVYHVDADIWGDSLSALNLDNRLNGLQIGDEFIFHGTNPGEIERQPLGFDISRSRGTYASPLVNVKAGTVVTTFGTTHYKAQSLTTNPYKDYATTIVLDRGDSLAGRPVGGRIFINFTEQPNRWIDSVPAHVLPGSPWDDGTAKWPNTYLPETSAQRDWEWSETRVSTSNTALSGRLLETTVTMPDGSTQVIRGSSSGGLIAARYTNLFNTVVLPHWDMTRRGMWWVGRGERAVEGEVRVGGASMTATAAMPQPVVTAQKDGGYNAQPMVALAQATKVAEDQSGDVEVVTLPWTAYAQFTGFSKVVSAGPMEADATLVENFDMVHATGEQVVLTLHGVDATLYLKEED